MNKSKTVILRVEPELKDRLAAEADEIGVTLSEHIRQLLIAATFNLPNTDSAFRENFVGRILESLGIVPEEE